MAKAFECFIHIFIMFFVIKASTLMKFYTQLALDKFKVVFKFAISKVEV